MFDVYAGAQRVLTGFKDRARAQAYCDEWRIKAGRTDLHVVINEEGE